MKSLFIDLETRSDKDLAKTGVYCYAGSPHFAVLLFAFSVDDAPVVVIDIASGEKIPENIVAALTDDSVEKHSFNASFERVCLSAYLRKELSPESWKCTMISSAYLGLPLSLAGVGSVLRLKQQKMTEGKSLIRYFCLPYDYQNGTPLFHNPSDALDKWSVFKEYNKRDVETEMCIHKKISRFPVPDFVWDEYHLDQRINDRGILVDMKMVGNAIRFGDETKEKLTARLKELTGLENPNSVQQMKEWLAGKGIETDTLGKKDVEELLKNVSSELHEVLKLRQQTSKSSVMKYTAMQTAVCADNRARGMFQFYGANRTGREAGRIIQLQNLPQNHMPDLESARGLVCSGSLSAFEMLYDDVPDTLSQLIRTAFIPEAGKHFVVADFSAIEARVIAWLAGETWRIKAFENGEDIYCASASRIYGVSVVKHGENGHLRQKGKVAELACGYGGSVGAMKAMGGTDMSDEELQQIVNDWRKASPNIIRLWYDVQDAAVKAVAEKTVTETHGIKFSYESGFMFIELPSGRRLAYVKPRIEENQYGKSSITYEGQGASKKWERLETYYGKLVENIVQGIARDLLFNSMKNLSSYDIVGHVHDEVIIETNDSVDTICRLMEKTPEWAKGLSLRAAGYECSFYMKD